MIRFSVVADGLDDIIAELGDMEMRARDLMPLAVTVGNIMATDNMVARMLGVDRDGQELQPLAESTLRRWPNRVGEVPLLPMEQASSSVSDFTVSYESISQTHINVIGEWPNMPSMPYHATGTIHMPQRDVVGLRPIAWAAVGDAFDQFTDSLVGGTF